MVPPHPGGIFAACGRCRARPSRLWGSGTDVNPAGKDKSLKWLQCSVSSFNLFWLVEYTLRLQNSARLPHISYMPAAVVEHLSERSELCGAIANKRMYEIRKRSVFSKRSVYLPQTGSKLLSAITILYFPVSPSLVPPARCISRLHIHNSLPYAAAGSLCSL